MSKKSMQNVKNQLDLQLHEGKSTMPDPRIQILEVIDFCNLCKSPAALKCQRCGDSYCSNECQSEDWQRHRHICFPMPALVQVSNLLTKSVVSSAIRHDQTKITPEKHQQVTDSKSMMPPAISKSTSNGSNDIMSLGIKTLNLNSNQIPTVKAPENNSYVILTSFPFAHWAFVRSESSEVCKLFNDSMHKIEQVSKNAQPLRFTEDLIGKLVVTRQNGIMCRGSIYNVRSKHYIIVKLLDSGFNCFRKLDELYEMPAELLQIPILAVPIYLNNVKQCEINRQLREFLSNYLTKRFKLTYTRHGHVKLFDCETNSSVNDAVMRFCAQNAPNESSISSDCTIDSNNAPTVKINEHNTEKKKPSENGFDISNAATSATKKSASGEKAVDNSNNGVDGSTPNSGRNVLTKQERNDDRHIADVTGDSTASNQSCAKKIQLKHVLFPEHVTPEEAIVVDTSTLALGYVGCIATSHIHHLKDIQEFLLAHMDDIPYKPSLDEIIIAKFENEWYRAKVIGIEKSGIKYTVLYVDFTNLQVVTCDEIRRYPSNLTIPCYTNLCLISGLPDKISVPQVKFLQGEIEVNSTIRFDMVEEIIDFDQQTVLVRYDCLLKKMQNAGLL